MTRGRHALRRHAVRSVAIFGFALLALPASQVAAKAFKVNTATDAVDAAPGDGVCETAPGNQQCSLRAAIQESNALPGTDTVAIPAGTYTLALAGGDDTSVAGDLDVTESLDIKGAGSGATILDGAALDRVFDLQPTAALVRIANVTIQNGHAGSGGGAIRFACPLRLYESRLRNNQAVFGGALYADINIAGANPSLTMVHSELRSNHAHSGAGAYASDASAVSIRDSEFVQNAADTFSGGLEASNANVSIRDSHFANNTATGFSALIANSAMISGSTFEANANGAVAGAPGAVEILGQGEVNNCTFSGNIAPNGGALVAGANAMIDVDESSFVSNVASNGDPNQGAAIAIISGGAVSVANSLFALNHPSTCSAFTDPVSVGFNTDDDGGNSCSLNATGDVHGTQAPLVDPMLKDNGGPTATHALIDGSPAIDSANLAMGTFEPVDQRGASRPAHGAISIDAARPDRGAFEVCKPELVTSLQDTDLDGNPDQCDGDDDDDGCPDAYDDHPSQGAMVAGKVIDFCTGNRPWYAFEGMDSDGDGLRNCEDPDDDDDGVPDEQDACPISALPSCLVPGNYPCRPSWVVCLGGSCVELFLKFYEVVNPAHQVRFDKFQIVNDTFYVAPVAGTTAAQSIRNISTGFVSSTPTASAASTRTPSARVAMEIWQKATRTTREHLVAAVMQYDSASASLGALDSGNVIVMQPPARDGSLALRTSWAIAADPATLPDADADRVPDGFDNCTYVTNVGQADTNRNGIGDVCEAAPVAGK